MTRNYIKETKTKKTNNNSNSNNICISFLSSSYKDMH